MRSFTVAIAFLLAISPVAWGGESASTAEERALAERAARLAAELRCLVCQNQSIADSSAELAVDLRRQIREQIAQGRSDGEIADYMVQRYGDFVLYRPPFKLTTLLLWLGPLLLLALGASALAVSLAARRRNAAQAPLSEDERARVAALLAAGDGDERR